MRLDWTHFVDRLRGYPPNIQRLQLPCSEDRLEAVENELGKMPDVLIDMLRTFNGAELFLKHGPFITIFGVATTRPLSPLEWAPDWYIDKFTPAWRRSWKRDSDWVIAVTNYGGVNVLQQGDKIREWDSSQKTWGPELMIDEWIEWIFKEGEASMRD